MMTKEEKNSLASIIYERHSIGEISLDERENLIKELNNKYIKENTLVEDFEIDEDVLDKLNIFKEAVYEKYSNGEITLETREKLIARANEEFADMYMESDQVNIFKKKIDELRRKNSHKRDDFKKKKMNKFNNDMIVDMKEIIEKNERNLKNIIFCYPHYTHLMKKDTEDAVKKLREIIEEIDPIHKSIEENRVIVDKYKKTAKEMEDKFEKYENGVEGYIVQVHVNEFYKHLCEFAEHMTDDLNMLETADKSIYDSVLAKSKQIKDKVIYNALNSMYTEYCQFSSFILSLYTMEISSYYRGIYFLNKYNKDHREHEMTPQSQLKLNIDNDLASKNAKLKIRFVKLYTNYDDIKESAYNRYYNGEITLEMREELINRATNEFSDVFITEKATREQYRIKAFKKKYHYDPKDKSIIVDGEKYYVDLDVSNPVANIKDGNGNLVSSLRYTSANVNNEDGTIVLDANFFKLKNSKRRDAMLKHEIGHIKRNSLKESEKIDQPTVQLNYDAYVKEMFTKLKSAIKPLGLSDKEILSIIKSQLKEMGITRSSYEPTSAERKKQKNIREIRSYIEKKYTSKRDVYNDHTDFKEIEADRYAVDHSSERDFKKGLKEYTKHAKSKKSIKKQLKAQGSDAYGITIPASEEVVSANRKKITRGGEDDYNRRVKALSDKTIQNNSAYKK